MARSALHAALRDALERTVGPGDDRRLRPHATVGRRNPSLTD